MKPCSSSFVYPVMAGVLAFSLFLPACAQASDAPGHRLRALKEMIENNRENDALTVSEEDLGAHTKNLVQDHFDGRGMLVYLPSQLPPQGKRGMVVALHGGGGDAQFVQAHLKMDGVAEQYGFIVAYLDGSQAGSRGATKMLAWNAGSGCCGEPYRAKVDDVGYIAGAVHYLEQKYGVDPGRTWPRGVY